MMNYSEAIVEEYRTNGKAIINKDDLFPGMTVWSNYYKVPKVILGIFPCSMWSHSSWNRNDIPIIIGNTSPANWVWFTDGTDTSLSDNNVCDKSYNPWMFFHDMDTMLEFMKKIDPTITY